ncbi:MAG: DUF6572 domain-containing protein [Chthoniobacterales bacterium]
MTPTPPPDRTGIIDLIGHDEKTGETVLVMEEFSSWTGSDEQLHALQERFNAYASFLLDGELEETHPELSGKNARIELRCAHMPDPRALDLLGMIHDQLEFQSVRMEVIVKDQSEHQKL